MERIKSEKRTYLRKSAASLAFQALSKGNSTPGRRTSDKINSVKTAIIPTGDS
jgi:hypothetical protein